MSSVWIKSAGALLSVSGTTLGWVTVADATPFYPGAEVWLSGATYGSKRGVIVELGASNTIGIRLLADAPSAPTYGKSDLSAFLTTDAARIDQEAQAVRVDQPVFAKVAVYP